MQTKVLIVAVVKKGGAVLMRKKPDGSLPYKETCYLFGAEANADQMIDETLKTHVKRQSGIDISVGHKFS